MEPEVLTNLFDSLWYNHEIFKKHSIPSSPSNSDSNPYHKTQNNPLELISLPTSRSKIDLLNSDSGQNSGSSSPVSVLDEPILQSGKEKPQKTREMLKKPSKNRRNRARTEGGSSSLSSPSPRKSLSELEFEEVKGFMDLGYSFFEEDLNSGLVEIIPGLKKLIKNRKKTGDCREDEYCKSRPYLSEAWEAMENERMMKKKKALMKWRFPAMKNEDEMKENLKWWAHTVASTL